MLLFWPCAWGLTIGYDFSNEKITFIFYLILFLAGSILMRSAGCIINDIVDRKFDKKVSRTKNRPIASGKVSVFRGLLYSSLLCIIAFFVLLQFNYLTIIMALVSMPLAFIYPLMKRYTYWPQLFLGITFNYGLILGWTSVSNEINIIPIIMYIGAIFWTLGYDTIYGYQDIKDDEIIGLKSTSIKFKKNPKTFLYICYSIFLTIQHIVGLYMKLNMVYYIILSIAVFQLYNLQIKKLNIKKQLTCFQIFKSNNFLGFIIFLGLLFGKINY